MTSVSQAAAPQAEIVLLGCCLLDSDLIPTVAYLQPSDFSLHSHRVIFAAMRSMSASGMAVDLVTLSQKLSAVLPSIGGVSYLASLTEGMPRRPSVESYARAIKEASLLRKAARIGQTIVTSNATEVGEVIAQAQSDLDRLNAERTDGAAETVGAYFQRTYSAIDDYGKRTAKSVGVTTGLREYDRLTCGLQPAEMTIIAARPGMGKSAWAMNIAEHAAVRQGRLVAFYSLEMSKAGLFDRLVCSMANLSLARHREGILGREEIAARTRAIDTLLEAPLWIDDTSGLSVDQIMSSALRIRPELVVVDYIQLVTPAAAKNETREQQVGGIGRGLKSMAKRLGVPVVALSQLKRHMGAGKPQKPVLSDLRESGGLEQEADVVALIHRDGYYDREDASLHGKAEIIVAKHRQGALDTVLCTWRGESTKFVDEEIL